MTEITWRGRCPLCGVNTTLREGGCKNCNVQFSEDLLASYNVIYDKSRPQGVYAYRFDDRGVPFLTMDAYKRCDEYGNIIIRVFAPTRSI